MTTALELGPSGWQKYLATNRHRSVDEVLSPQDEAARQALLREAKEAAAALKERFAAQRVILFGSLVHASWYTPDSDIDLAIAGLDKRDYWRAWRLVEDLIPDRAVDLIDLDAASSSLKRAILDSGIEL